MVNKEYKTQYSIQYDKFKKFVFITPNIMNIGNTAQLCDILFC